MQRTLKLGVLGAIVALVAAFGFFLHAGQSTASAAMSNGCAAACVRSGIADQAPPPPPPPPPPGGGGAGTVTFSAGWNLVGGPTGTVLTGATGNIFTFQAADTAYESFAATTPLAAPQGYWAFFTASATVTLGTASSQTSVTVTLPAGHFIMVGDPFTVPVSVTGADQVLVYNPTTGQYTSATTLNVGQGAWVKSNSGGTLTISTNLTPPPPPGSTATPTPTPVAGGGTLLFTSVLPGATFTGGCSFSNGQIVLQSGTPCIVTFQSTSAGVFTITGGGSIRLGCLSSANTCTAGLGGVNLEATAAGQPLTFTISQ